MLTSEQRAYKKKTLQYLESTLPLLESKLAQAVDADTVRSLQGQIDEIEGHILHLQAELEENRPGEPVADEYCRKIARALVREKYFLARRYLQKLETIEPFYPGLDRLREEVEGQRAGRRTRSIAEGKALPYGAAAFAEGGEPAAEAADTADETAAAPARWRQFFQFHIVLSCLVVALILCGILGVGGVTILQWLIEG
ncbi:MAG: hypothetical protein D6784_08780 [Chloroflexi bacterium]|nr:MAG: hypothetical protein D6784_08780 [Chloroflexota bacterium]